MSHIQSSPDDGHSEQPHEIGTPTRPVEGPITREMLCARTLELTARAGRSPHQIRQSDYERAKRELTGEYDSARQQAILNP